MYKGIGLRGEVLFGVRLGIVVLGYIRFRIELRGMGVVLEFLGGDGVL